MVPLSASAVPSVEVWLSKAPYPEARKRELKKLYDYCLQEGFTFFDSRGFPSRAAYCKCFLKNEGYPTYKFARGIFSRTDFFKVYCAPYFKAIEDVLFRRKEFIKKIPVAQRAAYIDSNYLYNTSLKDEFALHTLNTDYSSFECSFSKDMIESCEEVFYRYMLQDVPDSAHVLDVIMKVLKGTNVLKFRSIVAKVQARRMSGEMNTSLGNGFTNLMVYLYLCELKSCENRFVLIEGDDLLAQYYGPLFTVADYEQFGLIVKTVYVNGPNEASFCGQLYDRDSHILIADPIKVILNFSWTEISQLGCRDRKLRTFLRAKALSYAYQYYQCPIIYPLAQTFLRLTCDSKVGKIQDGWRNYLVKCAQRSGFDFLKRDIPDSARMFMFKQFHITVADQIAFEQYLDNIHVVQPLQHDSIDRYITGVCKEFDLRYVRHVDTFCAMRSNLQF